MVEKTPRLDLDDYEPGEDWDHSDTVLALDEHAIVRGPVADRPVEGNYDDELYAALDQGIIWRWDADAADWVDFGDLQTLRNRTSGLSDDGSEADLEALSTEEINNTKWAFADTDLQSLLDGLNGDAHIKLNTEQIGLESAPLTWPTDKRVSMEGTGAGSVIHNPATDGSHAIVADYPNESPMYGFQMQDLRITGTSESGDGIHLSHVDVPNISNVVIDGVGRDGIRAETAFSVSADDELNHTIHGCDIINVGRNGIRLTNECHDVTLTGCDIENCGQYGIVASGSIYNLTVTGTNIEDNADCAIRLNTDERYCTFTGNQIEASSQNTFRIDQAYQLTIGDNNIRAAGSRGIRTEGEVAGASITGNSFHGPDYAISMGQPMKDSSVSSNTIQPKPGTDYANSGIVVQGDGLTVTGNTIVATHRGIWLTGNNWDSNVTIADNTIKLEPAGSGVDEGTGIVFRSAENASVHDNIVTSLSDTAPNYGIYFDGESTPHSGIVHDNILQDCATPIGGTPDSGIDQHDNKTA